VASLTLLLPHSFDMHRTPTCFEKSRSYYVSVLGEGEFYGFYVHRRWGANFEDLNLPHLKCSGTHFSLNRTTGNSGSNVVAFDPSPNTPPPFIQDSNLVVRELLEEIEIECARQSLDHRYI
jgi:hypothetical protein